MESDNSRKVKKMNNDMNNNNNENVDKNKEYYDLSNEDKYKYNLNNYGHLFKENELVFNKSYKLKYHSHDVNEEFYFDHDLMMYKYKELNFNNINEVIMYIRVYKIGNESINWIHPFYSTDVQFLDDDTWKPIYGNLYK